MSSLPASDQYLQTEYVFIDTEAFQRARFDWNGKVLSKLTQFAKDGHLRLLMTDITKQEVCSHLQEALLTAATAAKKHAAIFEQLQLGDIIAKLDAAGALANLVTAFDTFLKAANAINVPMVATLDTIFSDYFARRPPFSEKKKHEFPDAAVIASLRAWCDMRNVKAYVVSGDSDLKNCCTTSGPLLYAASIEEIISQATVSQEVHSALEHTIFDSETLKDSLEGKLQDLAVVRGDLRLRRFSGSVVEVGDINVYSVNVFDREGLDFMCEVEFEARLLVRLEIEPEGHDYDEYESPRSPQRDIYRSFTAEIVVKFDPQNPEDIEYDSVHVFKKDLELDVDDFRSR